MENASNRRRRQRVTPPEVLHASMGLRRDFRVINLSGEGVMVEHAERLSPGQNCVLGLRLAGMDLSLHGRVVWSQVHSAGSGHPGQREIRYRSGLHFPDLPEAAASHISQYLATVIGQKAAPPQTMDSPKGVTQTSRPPSPTPPATLASSGAASARGEVPIPSPAAGRPAGLPRLVGGGNRRTPPPSPRIIGPRRRD